MRSSESVVSWGFGRSKVAAALMLAAWLGLAAGNEALAQGEKSSREAAGGVSKDAKGGDCKAPTAVRFQAQGHAPDKSLTDNALRALAGPAAKLRLRNTRNSVVSCVEIDSGGLRTPGGELGEVLIALSAFEEASGSRLTEARVRRFLEMWIGSNKRGSQNFHFHTSQIALGRIGAALQPYSELDVPVNVDLSAPGVHRDRLLGMVQEPDYQGSSLFAAVLRDPGTTGFRPGLTKALLRSYFGLLWDGGAGGRMRLDVLGSPKVAKAWFDLRASAACEAAGMAPSFSHVTADSRAYANHPAVMPALRARLADMLSRGDEEISSSMLLGRMRVKAARARDVLAREIAADLPFYTVTAE